MLWQFYLLIPLLCCNVGAEALTQGQHNSTQMILSIISRNQGIMSGTGGSSELLQAGVTQKAFTAFINQYPDHSSSPEIRQYIQQSASSVAPFVLNATYDALSYPMDRLSNGNALLHLSRSAHVNNTQLAAAATALRGSIDLNRRNTEGGLWYYVYPSWSYLDGMYSLAPFYTLESISDINAQDTNTTALDDMLYQLELLWQHTRNSTTGLLVHGYDDSRTAVWANPITGASPHVWGRSLGWFSMALVDTLELLNVKCYGRYHQRVLEMFQALAVALIDAVDPASGAWWQVLDEPGREGNYIESSGSAMFAYSLLKGARLGCFGNVTDEASAVGLRAHAYLTNTFVVRNTNGTLGYNGTVAVCSLNSTASYEVSHYAVSKMLELQSAETANYG